MKQKKQVKVGDCISIYWAGDRKWYYGQVLSWNEVSKECEVLYDDGEKEMVNLKVEKYEVHEKQLDWVYVQDGRSETKRWKSLKSTVLELVCKLRQSGGHVDTVDWWERWEANMSRAFLSRNIVGMSFAVVEIARKMNESISTTWWFSQRSAWEKEIQEAKTSLDLLSSVEKLVTDTMNRPISDALLEPSAEAIDSVGALALHASMAESLCEPFERQLQVVLPNETNNSSCHYGLHMGNSEMDLINTSSSAPQSTADSTLATLSSVENREGGQLISIMEENLLTDVLNGVNEESIAGAADFSVYPDSLATDIAIKQQMKSPAQSAENHVSFFKEQDSENEIGVLFADIPKTYQIKDDDSVKGRQLKDQEQERFDVENRECFTDAVQDQGQQTHLKNHNQAKANHLLSILEQGPQIIETEDSEMSLIETSLTAPQSTPDFILPTLSSVKNCEGQLIQIMEENPSADLLNGANEESTVGAADLSVYPDFLDTDIAVEQQMKDPIQSAENLVSFFKEQGSENESRALFADIAKAHQVKDDDSVKGRQLKDQEEEGFDVEDQEDSADAAQDQGQQTHLKNHNQAKTNHLFSIVKLDPQVVEIGDSKMDVIETSFTTPQFTADSMIPTLSCAENHEGEHIQIMEENQSTDILNGLYEKSFVGVADLSVYPDFSATDTAIGQQMKSSVQSADSRISFFKEQGSQIEIGVSFADIAKAHQITDDDSEMGRQEILDVENRECSADAMQDQVQQTSAKNHNQAKAHHMFPIVDQGPEVESNKVAANIPDAQCLKDQKNYVQIGIREAFSDSAQGKEIKDPEEGPPVDIRDSYSSILKAQQTKHHVPSGLSNILSENEQGLGVQSDEFCLDVQQAKMIDPDEARQRCKVSLEEQVSQVETEISFDVIQAELMNDQEQGLQVRNEALCADISEKQQMTDQDQSRHSNILSTNEQASEVAIQILNVSQLEQMDQDQSRQKHILTDKDQLSQGIGMSFSDIFQGEHINVLEHSSHMNVESCSNIADLCMSEGKYQQIASQESSAKKKVTQIEEPFIYTAQLEEVEYKGQALEVEIRESSADRQARQVQDQNQGVEISEPFGDNLQEEQIKDQDQDYLIVNRDVLGVVTRAQEMKDKVLSTLSGKGLLGDTEDPFADASEAGQLRYQSELTEVHTLAEKEQEPQVKLGFISRESVSTPIVEHVGSKITNLSTGINSEKMRPRTERNGRFDFMRTMYVNDQDFMEVSKKLQFDKPSLSASQISWLKYSTMNGFLYFKKRLCIVKDDQLRNHLIFQNHASAESKHLNFSATYNKLSAVYYWPRMIDHVKNYVRSCSVCIGQENISLKKKNSRPPSTKTKRPWENVFAKLVNAVQVSSQGHDCILVVVDIISRQTHFIACKKTSSAEEIARLYFWEVVKLHGIPLVFHSDDALIFRSTFWGSLWKGLGTTVKMGFPDCGEDYEFQKTYETLEGLIKSYIFLQQQHWEENLHLFEFLCNNSAIPSSGVSPFKTIYGHDLFLPCPSSAPADRPKNISDFVIKISSALQVLQATQASYIEKPQEPANALEDQAMDVAVEESCILNADLLQAPYQNTRKRKFGEESNLSYCRRLSF